APNDVVCLDRELAPAAIDEHRELDLARAPVVEQRVEGRTNGATGEQHVIHEHDVAAVDRERDLARADARIRKARRRVVAVERDVDGAHRDLPSFELLQPVGEAAGEWHAAASDADEDQPLRSARPLRELPGHAAQAAFHTVGVQENSHERTAYTTPASTKGAVRALLRPPGPGTRAAPPNPLRGDPRAGRWGVFGPPPFPRGRVFGRRGLEAGARRAGTGAVSPLRLRPGAATARWIRGCGETTPRGKRPGAAREGGVVSGRTPRADRGACPGRSRLGEHRVAVTVRVVREAIRRE